MNRPAHPPAPRLADHHNDAKVTNGAPAPALSAALQGASMAFGKPPAKPPAKPGHLKSARTGDQDALAAATKAGLSRNANSRNRSSISTAHSAERLALPAAELSRSAAARDMAEREGARGLNNQSPMRQLEVPNNGVGGRSRSPSEIAASLATSRMSPQVSGRANASSRQSPTSRPPTHDGPAHADHADILPTAGTVRKAKAQFLEKEPQPAKASPQQMASKNLSPARTQTATTAYSKPAPKPSQLHDSLKSRNGIPHQPESRSLMKSTVAPPPIVSPKPVRPLSSELAPLRGLDGAAEKHVPKNRGTRKAVDKSNLPSPFSKEDMQTVKLPTKQLTSTTVSKTPAKPKSPLVQKTVPEPPPARRRPQSLKGHVKETRHFSDHESDTSSSEASYASAPETPLKPTVPPPRRTKSRPSVVHSHTPSGRTQVVRTTSISPDAPNERRVAPRGRNASRLIPTQDRHPSTASHPSEINSSSSDDRLLRRANPPNTGAHLSSDSLANAIVASTLASSRASSPSAQQAPALPRRPSRSHNIFHHHYPQNSSFENNNNSMGSDTTNNNNRTPSPPKQLRQTMRAPPKHDESALEKHKHHFLKKAPNRHHEGTRKRWRDELTDRERKRYEGVFAANRGLYVTVTPPPPPSASRPTTASSPDPNDYVSNLVVRDIWSRSRLPDHVLEEVWDLVDREGKGRLGREEFVVGLWLVDQRLRGRKLPPRVTESVWRSVRRLAGVRLH
ncbi:MAG: hypothetical protein M1819_005112 [Sarea resinae]|nr:MAG: hypothetical protein M1819_005112 [Sarea resinae]